jgi:hypothetical protein
MSFPSPSIENLAVYRSIDPPRFILSPVKPCSAAVIIDSGTILQASKDAVPARRAVRAV